MELRQNIKKYLDIAYDGEPIIVPRKGNRNVVIISEPMFREYERHRRNAEYLEKLDRSWKQYEEGNVIVMDFEDLKKFE